MKRIQIEGLRQYSSGIYTAEHACVPGLFYASPAIAEVVGSSRLLRAVAESHAPRARTSSRAATSETT